MRHENRPGAHLVIRKSSPIRRIGAIACFDQALADIGLANDGALRQVLHYFSWATTTTMSRYFHSADDVPKGLSIPHWSWDGLRPYRYDFIWSDPAFECRRKTEFSSPVTSDRDV